MRRLSTWFVTAAAAAAAAATEERHLLEQGSTAQLAEGVAEQDRGTLQLLMASQGVLGSTAIHQHTS
jgi:hypothetical protein